MTRAAIYVRISLDQSGDQLGIVRQEEECRAICGARGWEVAEVCADNSISATKGQLRPSYEALLADAWALKAGTKRINELLEVNQSKLEEVGQMERVNVDVEQLWREWADLPLERRRGIIQGAFEAIEISPRKGLDSQGVIRVRPRTQKAARAPPVASCGYSSGCQYSKKPPPIKGRGFKRWD